MSTPRTPVKVSETEKITINLGPVDLGQIDLLVEEGFYSNRTDLIRIGEEGEIDRSLRLKFQPKESKVL